jgi:hypothetical protein
MTGRHDENPEVRYEHRDVSEGSTFWFGVGILAVMVVVAFLAKPLYDMLAERESATQPPAAYVAEANRGALEPPAPRLQVRPENDLEAFRAREDAILTTYAWVDKEHGVVRIPIQEAMRIVAERGMPDFPSSSPTEMSEENTP